MEEYDQIHENFRKEVWNTICRQAAACPEEVEKLAFHAMNRGVTPYYFEQMTIEDVIRMMKGTFVQNPRVVTHKNVFFASEEKQSVRA